SGLERQLRVKLLVRSSTGVRATEAGTALLGEARAVLARRGEAVRAMARVAGGGGGGVGVGSPLGVPPRLLSSALAEMTEACPDTRVRALHMSTAEQLAALHAGDLDVGLLRERPTGQEFDAMLVNTERLGVLLDAELTAEVAGPDGVGLDAL